MKKKAPVALTRDDKQRLFPPRTMPDGSPRITAAQRERETLLHLCELQSWKCFWCGQPMTDDDSKSDSYRTLEHVIPKAMRGKGINALPNLKAACNRCNNLRARWNIGSLEKENLRLKRELTICQQALERHRITMAGRCYFCKWRFHLKEWWYRQGARV